LPVLKAFQYWFLPHSAPTKKYQIQKK